MSQGPTWISVRGPMALSEEGAILPMDIDSELLANPVKPRC